MARAAIYIATYPTVLDFRPDELEGLSPEKVARLRKPIVPMPADVQERACRAYCERMGYSVFGVYRAASPPPENVRRQLLMGFDPPESFTFFHEYNSRHPYYWVRNLLESDTIDVIVNFRERGPSGNQWADLSEEVAKTMPREEVASLWEIEPPTETDVRMHELVRALAKAHTEEEAAPLDAELHALAEQAKQAKENSKQQESEARPPDMSYALKQLHKAQRGMASTKRALSLARKHAPALNVQLLQLETRVEMLGHEVQRVVTQVTAEQDAGES